MRKTVLLNWSNLFFLLLFVTNTMKAQTGRYEMVDQSIPFQLEIESVDATYFADVEITVYLKDGSSERIQLKHLNADADSKWSKTFTSQIAQIHIYTEIYTHNLLQLAKTVSNYTIDTQYCNDFRLELGGTYLRPYVGKRMALNKV